MSSTQVKSAIASMRSGDGSYFSYGAIAWDGLTESEREQLKQLLFHGPVWDGCVISKVNRDQLIDYGLATRCCFMGEQGFTVATYLAYSVHKQGHGEAMKPKPGIRG